MKIIQNPLNLTIFILIVLFTFSCENEVVEWGKDSDELVITEYIYNQPDLFSEFGGIIKVTGAENILRVRGPYTLMAPTNEAMQKYYARKNVSSYTELDTTELKAFVYNHVFQGEIGTGAIGLGALPFKNGLNEYVASDLQGTEIILNKTARIIKRNVKVSNGYVHHIDDALDVITKDVFQVLSSLEGYDIFAEGLVRAGISDTLGVMEFPYGNITAKTSFTLLAVPDTLYNREGIHSIDDLINTYGTEGDLSSSSNGFYQYMVFHCVSGTNYFSTLTSGSKGDIYYLISEDNYLNIIVGTDFMINKNSDGNYTGFHYNQSNIPAKNGVIHTVTTQLPNIESEPADIIFQVTDYFDLQQGDYYLDHYERFYDGQNTFKYIKWEAEYLMYYFKNEPLLDHDALSLGGHFWIEITTPKIRKGTYNLSTFMFFGYNAITAWYVDGVYLGQVDPTDGTWGAINSPLSVGDVTFDETASHVIRMQTVVPGGMWWDYVKFTPK